MNRGPVKKAAPCVITFATKYKKINSKTCIKYKHSFLITKEAKTNKLYKIWHIFIMVKKRKVKNSIRSLCKKAFFLRGKKQWEVFFAYLNDSTKPAGIANIFQPHRAVFYSFPVMRVGWIAPYFCVGTLQTCFVLRNAGLQNSGRRETMTIIPCSCPRPVTDNNRKDQLYPLVIKTGTVIRYSLGLFHVPFTIWVQISYSHLVPSRTISEGLVVWLIYQMIGMACAI